VLEGYSNGITYGNLHQYGNSEYRYTAYFNYTYTINYLLPYSIPVTFYVRCFDIISQKHVDVGVSFEVGANSMTGSG
jgi:hypothetical protein